MSGYDGQEEGLEEAAPAFGTGLNISELLMFIEIT